MVMLDYYATPNVRKACHLAKKGDPKALLSIARVLALQVGENDIVTPVPGRHGEPGHLLTVCEHISDITGCHIYDGIRGISRPSQYEAKKFGRSLSEVDLGMSLISSRPVCAGNHFIIDVVKDTGTTLNAALTLLPGARELPFARVNNLIQREASQLLKDTSPDNFDSIIDTLRKINSDGLAFAFSYRAVERYPDIDIELRMLLQEQFPTTQHAGIRSAIERGFIEAFNIRHAHIHESHQHDIHTGSFCAGG